MDARIGLDLFRQLHKRSLAKEARAHDKSFRTGAIGIKAGGDLDNINAILNELDEIDTLVDIVAVGIVFCAADAELDE